jgi:hypothetical protein
MSHRRCNQRCTLTKSARAKTNAAFDLISDALPFGRLWYAEPNAISQAIGYAMHYSRSHDAMIRVYDAAGNVMEMHQHCGLRLVWRLFSLNIRF